MVFHWSLSDSKSPQVSRTLLSILAVLSNDVVWMVSTRPPTFKSSSPFRNPLITVPNAPITIGIIVTRMFHSFFNSLARSRYLSFFSHSFSFILWLLLFHYLLVIPRSDLCILADINDAVVLSMDSFSNFQFLQFSFSTWGDQSKCINHSRYHRHHYVP